MSHAKLPVASMILVATFLPGSSGCSGRDDRQKVTGTVTVDGQPLASGAISFRPAADNPSNSSGGQIREGAYVLPAAQGLKPGKYTVTIQAFKETGRMVDDPQMGRIPEMAPLVFQQAGPLEATVAAEGANRFDFPLTTAPAARE